MPTPTPSGIPTVQITKTPEQIESELRQNVNGTINSFNFNQDNTCVIYSITTGQIGNAGEEIIGETVDWFVYKISSQQTVKINSSYYDDNSNLINIYTPIKAWLDNSKILVRDGDYLTVSNYYIFDVLTETLSVVPENQVSTYLQ